MHELDGAAQRLLRFARQHAVRVEVAHGAPSTLVRDVVEVALLGGVPQVARVDVEARVVAAQVGVEPRVGAARAQHGVAHLHAGALARHDARVVERDPSVVERLRDGDVHPRIGAGEHAQPPGAATTLTAAALAAPSTPSTRTVAQVRSSGRVASTTGSPATNSRYSRASSPMPVAKTSAGER